MSEKNKLLPKGFVIIASTQKKYYYAAQECIESLKDFYPEAHVTFFTHEEWVQDSDYQLFDNIVTEGVPNNIRAKLWALDKTPYELTTYLDADTVIQHEDIEHVFDLLPDDKDIVFTKNRPYNSKITRVGDKDDEIMTCHCGFFVYRNNESTRELMSQWYTKYQEQRAPGFDPAPYPKEVIPWDTFTMWWLLNRSELDIKWGHVAEPDARWNFVWGTKDHELEDDEIVIFHYTLPQGDSDHEANKWNK